MSAALPKVLVTGAGGFLGSHLVESLAGDGHPVRAFLRYNSRGSVGHLDELEPELRDRVEPVFGDLCDPFAVERAVEGCDVVFHLAALIGIPYSYLAPAHYVETNVRGTLHLLEACRRTNVKRLVHTSTSEVYGSAQVVPIPGSHPIVPQSPYAATKVAADALVTSYVRSFGLPAVTVRPFNTFGPRQSPRAIIPAVALQVLAGARQIRVGATTPVRDLTFVSDTVRAFRLAGEKPGIEGATIPVGTGRGHSVAEVIAAIQELLGTTLKVVRDEERVRPDGSEVERLVADRSIAAETLGFSAEVPLEEGLSRTLDWLRPRAAGFHAESYHV